MTQSTALPSAGDDEQVSLESDRRELAAPPREGVERTFVDSLAQLEERYRQLAR